MEKNEEFEGETRPPSLDFVDRIRLLVLDERNMLAREKREMLRHMDKMAKENASLVNTHIIRFLGKF
eukprot:1367637-Amorphochlora_amoeboformis.AAC.2